MTWAESENQKTFDPDKTPPWKKDQLQKKLGGVCVLIERHFIDFLPAHVPVFCILIELVFGSVLATGWFNVITVPVATLGLANLIP